MKTKTLPILPEHLIVEQILPRLPVKSLIRFKSVSKYWLSTICSHDFQKLQLQFSSSCPQVIIYEGDSLVYPSYLLSFDNCNNVKECVEFKYKYPELHLSNPNHVFDPPKKNHVFEDPSCHVAGSCDGLVCLYQCAFFFLWNPATNQCQHVDIPDCIFAYHVSAVFFLGLGFGYVSSIDDYRIGFMLRDDKNLKAQVYIYSLRAREWITMATVDCSFDWDGSQSVVANDTLYFPPGPPGIRHSHILGLNLVSGELKEYPLFNFIIGYCEVYVSRVKGCLSLCCFKYLNEDYTSKVFDLWMMKQPDEWNSWEKVFSISVGDLYLHCIFETGKCLVTREEQLEFIDPYEVAAEQYKDGSDICKGSREGVNFLVYPFTGEAWTYAESLISPFGTFTSNDNEDVSRVEEKS